MRTAYCRFTTRRWHSDGESPPTLTQPCPLAYARYLKSSRLSQTRWHGSCRARCRIFWHVQLSCNRNTQLLYRSPRGHNHLFYYRMNHQSTCKHCIHAPPPRERPRARTEEVGGRRRRRPGPARPPPSRLTVRQDHLTYFAAK